MRLLAPGIYEYDRKKPTLVATCERCGAVTERKKAKRRYCGPCAADRYDETVAANRHKYRGKKYGKQKLIGAP